MHRIGKKRETDSEQVRQARLQRRNVQQTLLRHQRHLFALMVASPTFIAKFR